MQAIGLRFALVGHQKAGQSLQDRALPFELCLEKVSWSIGVVGEKKKTISSQTRPDDFREPRRVFWGRMN